MKQLIIGSSIFLFLLASCNTPQKEGNAEQKGATDYTKEINKKFLSDLQFENKEDFEDARRGLVGTMDTLVIKNEDGSRTVWNLKTYDFLNAEEVPETVNPSLWRMAQLNMTNGLFKVTEGLYQVRGFDLSNMTIIEGKTGLIVIDPLTSVETAAAALNLYYVHRPHKPVVAVIYTHSHVDHFGGVKGIVSEADVLSGKIKIIAPEGFMEEAVSENVYAGTAMTRRSLYMYGALLKRGEKGQIDAGLGKTSPTGTVSLIAPNQIITNEVEKHVVDGVEIEFVLVPGTEAPSEMFMYYPQFKTLNSAEDVTHTLHNLYTLRGAQVRDAVKWWKAIDKMLGDYGNKTDIILAQHHWPKWGQEKIKTFMEKQRDGYKFIHDQTLHFANKGYTSTEIAEMIQFPKELNQEWHLRGYYGSLNHNVKAVYQKYLGWYDSNPANLHPLPPAESAKKYVEYMGGANNVLKMAKKAFDNGEYRWVAEVVNKVVFADPDNQAAKQLQADALEQLGYQSESAPWRNEYLMGAFELRNGAVKTSGASASSTDVISSMSIDMFLDFLGISLNAEKAAGKRLSINLEVPDLNEKYYVSLQNSVLVYRKVNEFKEQADVALNLPKKVLTSIQTGASTFEKEVVNGNIKISGKVDEFKESLTYYDQFTPDFNVVTP